MVRKGLSRSSVNVGSPASPTTSSSQSEAHGSKNSGKQARSTPLAASETYNGPGPEAQPITPTAPEPDVPQIVHAQKCGHVVSTAPATPSPAVAPSSQRPRTRSQTRGTPQQMGAPVSNPTSTSNAKNASSATPPLYCALCRRAAVAAKRLSRAAELMREADQLAPSNGRVWKDCPRDHDPESSSDDEEERLPSSASRQSGSCGPFALALPDGCNGPERSPEASEDERNVLEQDWETDKAAARSRVENARAALEAAEKRKEARRQERKKRPRQMKKVSDMRTFARLKWDRARRNVRNLQYAAELARVDVSAALGDVEAVIERISADVILGGRAGRDATSRSEGGERDRRRVVLDPAQEHRPEEEYRERARYCRKDKTYRPGKWTKDWKNTSKDGEEETCSTVNDDEEEAGDGVKDGLSTKHEDSLEAEDSADARERKRKWLEFDVDEI